MFWKAEWSGSATRCCVRAGVSVILDFGCWSPDERYALRAIADLAGADLELHYVTLPEDERRKRAMARWREAPEEIFEMACEDHERFRALFTPATTDELQVCSLPCASDPVRELARVGF